jgi:hypothetical protein
LCSTDPQLKLKLPLTRWNIGSYRGNSLDLAFIVSENTAPLLRKQSVSSIHGPLRSASRTFVMIPSFPATPAERFSITSASVFWRDRVRVQAPHVPLDVFLHCHRRHVVVIAGQKAAWLIRQRADGYEHNWRVGGLCDSNAGLVETFIMIPTVRLADAERPPRVIVVTKILTFRLAPRQTRKDQRKRCAKRKKVH